MTTASKIKRRESGSSIVEVAPVQVLTGALLTDNGATHMVLLRPNYPLISYRAALVQMIDA